MIQSKNLKLKLGLCGLALTSFLALNSRSVVHADTVSGSNAGAITWDSDQDDSQVVKEDSNQEEPSQSVQTQGAVQDQKAPTTQSVQSNVQKRAGKSAVRVSNFDTSVVNRNNAQNARNNANVKVATVHDTAQMPVQKQKVAQFNQGSKIYTLNGSSQLSKNNGDGYVITNAGTYNGRVVDIGVTINNVQNNQGTYTTKWSNGDKADVTGRTDANFKYQDSVLLNQQAVPVTVNKTRNRQAQVTHTYNLKGYYVGTVNKDGSNQGDNVVLDPVVLAKELAFEEIAPTPENADQIRKIAGQIMDGASYASSYDSGFAEAADHDGVWTKTQYYTASGDDVHTFMYSIFPETLNNNRISADAVSGPGFLISRIPQNTFDRSAVIPFTSSDDTSDKFYRLTIQDLAKQNSRLDPYVKDFTQGETPYTFTSTENVTDNLQVDQSTPASLGYNYTVGLYDAQTGDLITDLKAEYKGKTGVQATSSSSVMNNAIKNKIQQINQGQASVSYTGTSANDDVAFYQETRQVNPQDKNVNRQVQRVIHINFPNGVKPKSYDSIKDSAGNKLTLDSNNNLTQSMSFTRTGVQNIVNGHVTYGNWQQHGSINAVTLPSIPGYTMVTNN